ncbi:hypothetical protein F4780DRAFT_782378 [Xylariomycetidae sp. FL0641]|nr:hypothetical protein F4780DRAFT_782378 [Xylariomycetidae sp. FL0641]
MFGTLKVGKKNQTGMVFVEQPKQNRGATPHVACRKCRDRKLKCTGESTGCKRCTTANIPCEYPAASETRRNHKHRRTSSTASTIATSDASESPKNSPSEIDLEYQRYDPRCFGNGFEDTHLDYPASGYGLGYTADVMMDGSIAGDPAFPPGYFSMDVMPSFDGTLNPADLTASSDSGNSYGYTSSPSPTHWS